MVEKEKALVFKTANDLIVDKCLASICKKRIVCLTQSYNTRDFKNRFKDIEFIDIKRDSFHDLPHNLMKYLKNDYFEEIYIPISGKTAHNFGNVMNVLKEMKYSKAYFFYSDGKCIRIPNYGLFKELFIDILTYIYSILV